MADGTMRHWRNGGRPEEHEISLGLASRRYPQDTWRAECSCGWVSEEYGCRELAEQHQSEALERST